MTLHNIKTKQFFFLFLFYILSHHLVSQTTFPWSGTYGGAGASRTYTTTVSGTTINATIVNSDFDASQGWDGSYGLDGRDAQDGIYTYKILFKNPKVDERIIVTGHITLIR
jgi:hypothetical protein